MSKRVNDVLGPTQDRRFFKERLVSRMKELNLYPAELARQARISKDAVSSYMSMRSLPGAKTLERLAKVLQCKPSDLMPSNGASLTDDVFVEVREHSKQNYKLFVCRVPLPQLLAMRIASEVLEFIEGKDPPPASRRGAKD